MRQNSFQSNLVKKASGNYNNIANPGYNVQIGNGTLKSKGASKSNMDVTAALNSANNVAEGFHGQPNET